MLGIRKRCPLNECSTVNDQPWAGDGEVGSGSFYASLPVEDEVCSLGPKTFVTSLQDFLFGVDPRQCCDASLENGCLFNIIARRMRSTLHRTTNRMGCSLLTRK